MRIQWLDRLSDLNPQLFREIKGRFKARNVAIAGTISLVGQLLVTLSFFQQLPIDVIKIQRHRYCTGSDWNDYQATCLILGGKFAINWPLWWFDIFLSLSIISVFALLALGTYMLISDLAQEERKGTLNFLRVSPRSTQTIVFGKLLGVPVLMYFAALLAMPLHLWAGLSAHIPLGLILMFYGALVASCLFFYSAAQLFALVSTWLGGFQAWLGGGLVFIFLLNTTNKLGQYRGPIAHNSTDWLNLFNPMILVPYLASPRVTNISQTKNYFAYSDLESLQLFYWPIGVSVVGVFSFMLLNFALWTYWSWQGINRSFANPSTTLLSKRQSYTLAVCFQEIILGFSLQNQEKVFNYSDSFVPDFSRNLDYLLFFNLLLFLGLIAALSPHRQDLQDWARYRHQLNQNRFHFGWQDLIWGEKSPSPVAIALNLIFTSALLVPWILLAPAGTQKNQAFGGVLLCISLISIYALVAQLMLLMKTNKRGIWAAGTVGAAIALPVVIFAMLSLDPKKYSTLWLFSAFSWWGTKHALGTTVFLAFLGQLAIISGLSFLLTRQLKRAGESASKALLKQG